MKILERGHKSMRDGSPWTPGVWREELDALADGDPCGIGLHSLIYGDPLVASMIVWPCEVWEDEVECELGRDEIKARYRRQRIIKEITDEFSVIVLVNEFLDSIPKVRWLQPSEKPTPEWMMVEVYESLAAARNEATAWSAIGIARSRSVVDTAWLTARNIACETSWKVGRDAARNAAWNIAAGTTNRYATWDIGKRALGDATRCAAWDAGWWACAILVSDLEVDTTWLYRWWCAWGFGYLPLREDGEKLIVARIDTKGK